MPDAFNHALLVGSTGMLADAARWVIARSRHALVLGRDEEKLRRVTETARGRAIPGRIDHRDRPALQTLLASHAARHGPFDIGLVWLHADALPSLPTIADACVQDARLIVVRGSATADISHVTSAEAEILAQLAVPVQRVVLGFVVEPAGSRWLSHAEISRGAIDAIVSGRADSVVGATGPWESRP
ncbi:MAG TPA: hypothetical protein VFF65_06870 [Phycisphaerales bacterium]|nr:hypothetical protein [Phycisphaerales bacterium]